jgi:hypothetical protein
MSDNDEVIFDGDKIVVTHGTDQIVIGPSTFGGQRNTYIDGQPVNGRSASAPPATSSPPPIPTQPPPSRPLLSDQEIEQARRDDEQAAARNAARRAERRRIEQQQIEQQVNAEQERLRRDQTAWDRYAPRTSSTGRMVGRSSATSTSSASAAPSSAEAASLNQVLAYTQQAANGATAAAVGVETAIAGMSAGGVTGPALTELASAQEALNLAAQHFTNAHNTLINHIQVQEAYNANQDAGTRAYVTGD